MVLTLNKPNKVISIHKDNCDVVKNKIGNIDLNKYPNGYLTSNNQLWINENNFTIQKAQIFFKGLDYGKVFCSKCFGGIGDSDG